jgi:hypothetical protein
MWLQLVYRCLPSLSDGETVFRHLETHCLEASAYRSGRSPDWLKKKNPDAPAVTREAEEDWGR